MPPISRLFLPPSDIRGSLFAGIYRDTCGCDLSDADRYNHFPASPLVSVSLVLAGELYLQIGETRTRLPRLSVLGPKDTPSTSWSPGGVVALTVGMYFDAWQSLGGDPDFGNIPEPIREAMAAFAADTPEKGWEGFCTTLAASTPVRKSPGIHSITDWVRSSLTHAALTGRGQSLRSLERRVRRMTGQNRRALDFYAAFEQLHRISRENATAPLSEIAFEAGYADQSHMGRAVRRATGFTPAQLNHAIATEEPFWCYRLLGERF